MNYMIGGKLFLDEPRVVLYEDFLTHQECDDVRASALEFHQSRGFDSAKRESNLTDYRTSTTFFDQAYYNKESHFKHIHERIFLKFRDRFEYLNFKPTNLEPLQIQRYKVGQQYKVHTDFFNHNGDMVFQNDRIATLIVYLNDDFEGGETEFPNLGMKIRPKKGMGLYFEYKYIDELNNLTLHAGLPVTSGEKWIFTSWFHKKPFVGGLM